MMPLPVRGECWRDQAKCRREQVQPFVCLDTSHAENNRWEVGCGSGRKAVNRFDIHPVWDHGDACGGHTEITDNGGHECGIGRNHAVGNRGGTMHERTLPPEHCSLERRGGELLHPVRVEEQAMHAACRT